MTLRPDPIAYPPRGMSRDAAARYIGVSTTKFDEMVADGRMPKPKRVDARVIWDRLRLDAAFSDLGEEKAPNPFDRVFDRGAELPGKYPIGSRVYADGEWEELVRKSPLTKLERVALESFFCKPKGSLAYVRGAGPTTVDRLKARGFIAVLKKRDEGRAPYHEITPAGEAEWLRIKS